MGMGTILQRIPSKPKQSRLDVHKNAASLEREHLINHVPRGIDVRTSLNEQLHYEVISSRTSDMKGENAVKDRVYGLAVIESMGDETEISGCSSRVEAEIGD